MAAEMRDRTNINARLARERLDPDRDVIWKTKNAAARDSIDMAYAETPAGRHCIDDAPAARRDGLQDGLIGFIRFEVEHDGLHIGIGGFLQLAPRSGNALRGFSAAGCKCAPRERESRRVVNIG